MTGGSWLGSGHRGDNDRHVVVDRHRRRGVGHGVGGCRLILGRILRRADTEEQIVEIQRSQRDDSHTELS